MRKKNNESNQKTENMKIEMSTSVETSNPKGFILEESILGEPIVTKRSK